MEFPGEGREWLSAESPAAEALQDVIFEEKWHYVHNRHTGGLEVTILFSYIFFNIIFFFLSFF